jgi:electron transport complex protein RnfB
MVVAILALSALAGASGLLLGFAAVRFKVEGDPVVEKIDAVLPQTQCGQCGYAGCRPYAEAIVAGTAEINRCAPGGAALITALARLLGRPATPLDPRYGEHEAPQVAVIDEEACIGCAICISACPVDAIIGAAQFSHTVVRDACTGCKLCVAPCPVDCIRMLPLQPLEAAA